jgi:hypothetical protein
VRVEVGGGEQAVAGAGLAALAVLSVHLGSGIAGLAGVGHITLI